MDQGFGLIEKKFQVIHKSQYSGTAFHMDIISLYLLYGISAHLP
jgi:hypothetical protein